MLERFYETPSIARCLNPAHAMDSEICCHTSRLEDNFFPDDLSFNTPNGIVSFASLDRSQLNHILSLTMRDFLLRQVGNRHDCGEIPTGQQIDIELTRMLLDSSFSKASLHEIIQPCLQFDAKNILRQILAGKVFTGARLKAAGLVASNVCYHCDVREDHDHFFERSCNMNSPDLL